MGDHTSRLKIAPSSHAQAKQGSITVMVPCTLAKRPFGSTKMGTHPVTFSWRNGLATSITHGCDPKDPALHGVMATSEPCCASFVREFLAAARDNEDGDMHRKYYREERVHDILKHCGITGVDTQGEEDKTDKFPIRLNGYVKGLLQEVFFAMWQTQRTRYKSRVAYKRSNCIDLDTLAGRRNAILFRKAHQLGLEEKLRVFRDDPSYTSRTAGSGAYAHRGTRYGVTESGVRVVPVRYHDLERGMYREYNLLDGYYVVAMCVHPGLDDNEAKNRLRPTVLAFVPSGKSLEQYGPKLKNVYVSTGLKRGNIALLPYTTHYSDSGSPKDCALCSCPVNGMPRHLKGYEHRSNQTEMFETLMRKTFNRTIQHRVDVSLSGMKDHKGAWGSGSRGDRLFTHPISVLNDKLAMDRDGNPMSVMW